jgi:hypothetical protein
MKSLLLVLSFFLLDVVLGLYSTMDDHQKINVEPSNMNGLYTIANPNPKAPQPFSTDFASKNAEYFDIYSDPIRTVYGQVYWKMMDPIPLPPEIVSRFDGKTMAIIGYEANQVMVTDEGETFVPAYWSYNHHSSLFLLGKKSYLVEVDGKVGIDDEELNHGYLKYYMPMSDPDYKSATVPDYLDLLDGAEYRKAFHGYPKGYAHLIHSPHTYQVQPMQIDTHNRDYNGPGFKAGIEPKSSTAPPDADYSGLLECPCTTRIKKVWSDTYTTQFGGFCPTGVKNSSTCFRAVSTIVPSFQERIVDDPTKPTGCLLFNQDEQYSAFWNTNVNTVACPTSSLLTGSAKSVVDLSMAMDTTVPGGRVVITISGPSNVWFGVGFNAKQMIDRPYTVVIDGNGLVTERRIDDHAPGTLLTPTQVQVLSNNVENGIRTVVLSREFKGVTSNHYTFDPTKLVLPFINAVGRTVSFSHHQSKGSTTMVFHASEGSTCVCDSGITGTINGILFHNDRCAPYPVSELLDHNNPTCSVQNYIGGTTCCLHEYILLDADQPVDPRIDEIRLKYRILYQEYQPSQPPMTTSDVKSLHLQRPVTRIYLVASL